MHACDSAVVHEPGTPIVVASTHPCMRCARARRTSHRARSHTAQHIGVLALVRVLHLSLDFLCKALCNRELRDEVFVRRRPQAALWRQRWPLPLWP
jgi:hypothetical protein